jgi:octaprenyl-diphosphate synthase
VNIPGDVASALQQGLDRVDQRFERQLASDLPALQRLVRHVEHYRGKMLRPTLVLTCGLASGTGAGGLSDAHITCAAVCEMIHMATLVHDDVLDEAEVRRRGATVNRLHGNETAVILGDYLIAAAYHLCSQLQDQSIALAVGEVAMTLCSGELLQLSHREDLSLDEATYFEIIARKTGSLIALSCRLGGVCSGAPESACAALGRFGEAIGAAFQIQDDLLDLTARASALGKPVHQDMAKGKLTLPLVHHLGAAGPVDRGRSLVLLERAVKGDADAAAALEHAMERSGSPRSWWPAPRRNSRGFPPGRPAICSMPWRMPSLSGAPDPSRPPGQPILCPPQPRAL